MESKGEEHRYSTRWAAQYHLCPIMSDKRVTPFGPTGGCVDEPRYPNQSGQCPREIKYLVQEPPRVGP